MVRGREEQLWGLEMVGEMGSWRGGGGKGKG